MFSSRPLFSAVPGCRGLVLVAVALLCGIASAQNYPSRPVRFVVAAGPGGATDGLARIIGERLAPVLNQPVVYDNRPGAGGIIAGEVAARASPDGHTLLFSTSAAIAVSVSLYKKLPYDPVRDFAPVTLIATQPYMLIAHPSLPPTVRELVALAKAKPGQIGFAHTGAGTGTHLAGELFMRAAQVKLLSVPFKAIGQSITAVVSGEVPLTFTSISSAYAQAKAGRARALAVTGKTRSPAAPEVPTMAEAGVANYVAGNWYGVLAPAGTPRQVIVVINNHVNAILKRADIAAQLTSQGYEPAGSSPEEFGAFIKTEIAAYATAIRGAGIRPD
jgi:tripartite-type tricarboxylate transporter receptor subunit TctC